jgi:hypothetical protein
MKPGIHWMQADEYHADPCQEPSLSNSIAKILITQSPSHARALHPRLNPQHTPDESPRFDIGSAAHALLLEGDNEAIQVIVADDWRKKATQEMRDQARADNKYPILDKHFGDLVSMVDVAKEFIAGSELAGILEDGQAEQTFIWQEGEIWCRVRTDWLATDHRLMLDYKTCASAAPDSFHRQINTMHYDLQAAFYKRGLTAVGGPEDAEFIFLAQEIEPPYACSFHSLSNTFKAIADDKVRQAIEIWQECMATDTWPTYTNRICCAEPPNWVLNQFMEMMEQREDQ